MPEMQVSVVIPVYNAASYVTQAVESSLSQAETLEVLLVEDGSQDDSLRVCRYLEKKYDQVRVFQHPGGGNRGASSSRNLGMKNSRREFVAFLDADDFYVAGRFERAKEIFAAEPGCDGVYEATGIHFENDEGKDRWKASDMAGIEMTTMIRVVPPEELFHRLLAGGAGHIHLDGLVIRRSLLDKSGLMEDHLHSMHEDTDFILRLAAVGTLLPGRLAEAVGVRRVHAGNRVSEPRSWERMAQERMKMRTATYRWCRRHTGKEKSLMVLERMIADHLANSTPGGGRNEGNHGQLWKIMKLITLPVQCVDVLVDGYYWLELMRAVWGLFLPREQTHQG